MEHLAELRAEAARLGVAGSLSALSHRVMLKHTFGTEYAAVGCTIGVGSTLLWVRTHHQPQEPPPEQVIETSWAAAPEQGPREAVDRLLRHGGRALFAVLDPARAQEIRACARMYASAKSAAILWGMGVTQFYQGVETVRSLTSLAILTGNLGKPSAGVNPVRGQNNVQGACDMGALPDTYPGYQYVKFPENREKFALYFIGWLGGPQEYVARFGHPRLRMRHGRVPVDSAGRDAWMRAGTLGGESMGTVKMERMCV